MSPGVRVGVGGRAASGLCFFVSVSSYCKHLLSKDASSIQAEVESCDSTHPDTHTHIAQTCQQMSAKTIKNKQHLCHLQWIIMKRELYLFYVLFGATQANISVFKL